LQDPEALVRGAAAWAVGKLGGAQARKILESGMVRETADSVRGEIHDALQRV